jgi:hypothetical protein
LLFAKLLFVKSFPQAVFDCRSGHSGFFSAMARETGAQKTNQAPPKDGA